ncbi:hypothetical protein NQ318_006235 [Aromia moschata]|uniref:Uncharacterized protein n=1 Tax=Aromia moschata TaxID=1265417 RepID=A0AAV8XU83_9CUCU|nr:hypothetical protein NQ318_006235 [Aromia moschata]
MRQQFGYPELFSWRSLPKLSSQEEDGHTPHSQFTGVAHFEPIPHDHDFCERVVINSIKEKIIIREYIVENVFAATSLITNMMSEIDPDELGDQVHQETLVTRPIPEFCCPLHLGDQGPWWPGPSPRFSLKFDLNLNENGDFGVADHEYCGGNATRMHLRPAGQQ